MKRHLALSILLALSSTMVWAQDCARPWSFWYWMYGAVNKPAIKADLEGMKRVGLQGTYLMPIRGVDEKPEYEGKAQQLTPEFWDMVGYSMHVADSLGLQMGVHICDGFALAGGPWFTEEESMQKIVSAETYISLKDIKKTGSLKYASLLGGKGIAAYAIPCSDTTTILKPVAITHSDNVTSNEKFLISANEDCWMTFDFGKAVSVRNVEVIPSGTYFQCQRMSVAASADGVTFESLKDFCPPRQGWQNYLYNLTYSLPCKTDAEGKEKTYRYYRFSWTPKGTEPGSEDLDAAKWKANLRLKDIVFHHDVRIDQWEGKTALAWRIAKESTEEDIPQSLCIPKEELIQLPIVEDGTIDLTALLKSQNHKTSKSQFYRIVTIGHASTGMTNATAGGGKGLECDKFSKAAVNKLIDNWFCKFDSINKSISITSPREGRKGALRYLHVDSWECGCQNWSSKFADEFKVRRGYDLMPWLPVMAGIPVESASETERVLRDVRETINDLVNDNFFGTVRDRAHEMGMLFSSEAIAPTMVSDGLDHYRYSDVPMGEYWLNSPTHDKPNDMLDAISGGHIYGKNIIQAEGFTEVRGVWDETPASIKTLLDRNFALGMNRLFFHVNAHNPWLDKKPGMTLDGIGLFFQRDQTWYDESGPFVDYVTRCSSLLQQGRPVQDIAVYTGEEMPRRSILPERLVSFLPGVFGSERVASEKARLANDGQPLAESPVKVIHSAGIVDTKDWINPLHGYQYDSVNPDVLLNHSSAENGKMRLDGGAEYRVLVVPGSRQMNPNGIISAEAKAKIEEMRKAGVIIIDKPYSGRDFSQYGLAPDASLPEGIAYTHRCAADAEIYFLSNQKDSAMTFTAMLRDIKGDTFVYDPVRNIYNKVEPAGNDVNISLSATGSCFVISTNGDVNDLFVSAEINDVNPQTLKPSNPQALTVEGPYKYEFRENNMEKNLDELESWSSVEYPQEKYFSGHCMYTMHVRVKNPKQYATLSLGKVYDIAHVWVNGRDCGIVWTAPYEANIEGALKKGDNEIKIEVVNTWYNALRGMDEGKSPYPGVWTNAKYRAKAPYLLPAGLIGPVEVRK